MKTKKLLQLWLILLGGIIALNAQTTNYTSPNTPNAQNGFGNQNTFTGINTGAGNASFSNSAFGANALLNSSGGFNTAVGAQSMSNNSSGQLNAAVGTRSMELNTSGGWNVALGHRALEANTTGNNNVAVGFAALCLQPGAPSNNIGSSNIALGNFTPRNFFSGNNNIFIGDQTAQNLRTGNNNTLIGRIVFNANASTPLVAGNDTSNSIILADGGGNQRLFFNGNGFGGVGLGNNNIPQNTFEIRALNGSPTQAGFTASGLRLSNLTNTNFNTTPPTSNRRVLSVNGNGDVILVDDEIGNPNPGSTLTNNCDKTYFVNKTDVDGNLMCSQIYDNYRPGAPTFPPTISNINKSGVGVAIGWETPRTASEFQYNALVAPYPASQINLNPYPAGKFRLLVNGNQKVNGLWLTSDQNYKTEIGDLDKPLDRVLSLKGVHYYWDTANNPNMDFDEGLHTGFIAQEVEQVIPHLVVTQKMPKLDGKEDEFQERKSVNYIELIPYLVESIKAQQKLIESLQQQLVCLNEVTHCNSVAQRLSEPTKFENTQIVSVSPNPTKDKAEVVFSVEEEVAEASLEMYDLLGKKISSFIISERNQNLKRTFEKSNFGVGTYLISLVINGKSIDTKKIIFN